jgi:hypothetical protein
MYPVRAHHHKYRTTTSISRSDPLPLPPASGISDSKSTSDSETGYQSQPANIIAPATFIAPKLIRLQKATPSASLISHNQHEQLGPYHNTRSISSKDPSMNMIKQTTESVQHMVQQPSSTIIQSKGKNLDKKARSSLTNLSSIPKPSADEPFSITTNNNKLLGKSNTLLLSDTPDHEVKDSISRKPIFQQQAQNDKLVLPAISALLPPIQPHPLHYSESPDWLIPTIAMIINSEQTVLADSPFIFDMKPEAASHNSLVLSSYGNDIGNVINAHQHTFLRYGSEFRSTKLLAKLLMHHPRWIKFKALLDQGSKWPLQPINTDIRKAKNSELLERGNH